MRAENNIFEDVKIDELGISEADSYYDSQLISSINLVLMIGWQAGVYQRSKPFLLEDCSETWDDLIGNSTDKEQAMGVREWVKKRVKLEFDPPTNTNLLQATKDITAETEYRLGIAMDLRIFDGGSE